jgi:hypothetical protein
MYSLLRRFRQESSIIAVDCLTREVSIADNAELTSFDQFFFLGFGSSDSRYLVEISNTLSEAPIHARRNTIYTSIPSRGVVLSWLGTTAVGRGTATKNGLVPV